MAASLALSLVMLLDAGRFVESFSLALLLRTYEDLLTNSQVHSSLGRLESYFEPDSKILVIILRIPQSIRLLA